MSTTNKPVILELDGVMGQLPNGGMINAGGTTHGSFTVGGLGLLFDNGTSTAPGGSSSITLQTAYINSPNINDTASINLLQNKNFTVYADNPLYYFAVNGITGKVTITGDLEVLGSSSVINSIVQDSDHWLISPKAGHTTALKIEPDSGIIPVVDLVTVRRTFGTAAVLRVSASGNLFLTQDLTVGSTAIVSGSPVFTPALLNGVEIVKLNSDVQAHITGTALKHPATDIPITPISGLNVGLTNVPAANVQEALAALEVKVEAGGGGTGSTGNFRGYEHIQSVDSSLWVVVHNLHSFRITSTIYDANWEVMLAHSIRIIDNNTIHISFLSPMAGRAMILAF
jgi:hypothetical protein